MSRVISDARQTIVRASQLGDVIVSNITSTLNSTPSFTVILNIDVVFKTIAPLLCTNSHTLQNPDHSETCPTPSVTTLFRGDGDVTVIANDGSFPLETTPSHTFFATPSQENLLSNAGSFPVLDATPSFNVT